ncbi:MAG TPA: glucose/sorbosone family PQQ-dependent dehydrogenase [Devosiaceae bacterium]|jgi:PQQ-dependent dehydrogenase (s-GDH family)|nr:glucose/sorbosone family PQQ-dependent dehydrogenase [Devosiaceae bacterium]
MQRRYHGSRKFGQLLVGGSVLALFLSSASLAQENPVEVEQGQDQLFSARVLTTGLANPWEVTWGPDNMLWVTERSSGEVTRVDPYTGAQQTLLTLEDFSVDVQHQGLLGLALHPELLQGSGNDYVYLAHTYESGSAQSPDPRQRLVRYTYDEQNEVLVDPVELISGVPAWNDHNAGRVKIGPDMKIYYTLGEQGANFGGNYQRPNLAQELPTQEEVEAENWQSYSGKILRLNLDGSIPEDNPEIEGVRSHIFTYGHRNPQGIDFGADGTVYISEHGPDTDDELNVLEPGGNYGWPNVAGYRDDSGYIYGNWSEAPADLRYTGRDIPEEVPQYPESEFEPEIVEPIATYWTVDEDHDFEGNCGWICNPTIAPGSIQYYSAGDSGIPQWDNSVLLPTLKHGTLYVQQLSEDGTQAEGLPTAWFGTQNRYRDTAIGADNRTVFIATDNFGTAAQQYGDRGFTNVLHNPGAILVFTYEGEAGSGEQAGVGLATGRGEGEAASGGEAAEQPADETEAGAASPGTPEDGAAAPDEAGNEAAAPEGEGEAAAAGDTAAASMEQLFDNGQTLYGINCSACHGAAGQGAQGPALAGNEALDDTEYLARTIVHGFGYMPPFGDQLNDLQIAAVATYIRNNWGNDFGPVQPGEVAAQR